MPLDYLKNDAATWRAGRPQGYATTQRGNRPGKFHLCPNYPTTAHTLCGRDLGVPGWGADWNELQTDWASQGRRCCRTCARIDWRHQQATRRPA